MDININNKIYDIVQEEPRMLLFLINNGFENLSNEKNLNTIGKRISLAMSLKMKGINAETFMKKFEAFLDDSLEKIDISLMDRSEVKKGDITLEGILPCPIKGPLMDRIAPYMEEYNGKIDKTITYDLRSANLGLDFIKDQLEKKDFNEVPDILLSAGYDLFFSKDLMGEYIEKDLFEMDIPEINSDFNNDKIDLRDPKKNYHILGVVPAMFLVNTEMLNGRKMPESWEDLLSPEFEDSVSIPLKDLDLFNAIVLSLYKMYGDEGIKKLARSFKKSLHPSQMVKSKGKNEMPTVNIIPYFFTKMVASNKTMKTVWPKEGPIISPIFLIAKKEKKEILKPVIDFLTSKEMGEVFSENGKFPSTCVGVDNGIEPGQNFNWMGWDFINSNDIGGLLKRLEEDFTKEITRL